MHESKRIVVLTNKIKTYSSIICSQKTVVIIIAVDSGIVETQHTHCYATQLVVPVANKFACMGINGHQVAVFTRVHLTDSSGKHPWVEALQKLFTTFLQYYSFIRHNRYLMKKRYISLAFA